jgi:hypothetical protein
MSDKPTLILVNIKRIKDWFIATSEDLKGFHVADPDLSIVIKEIPAVIKALYKARDGIVVNVEEASSDDTTQVFPLRYLAEAA